MQTPGMKRILFSGLFLLMTTFIPVVTGQAPGDPLDPINRFHAGLIEMMKQPGYAEKNFSLRSGFELVPQLPGLPPDCLVTNSIASRTTPNEADRQAAAQAAVHHAVKA